MKCKVEYRMYFLLYLSEYTYIIRFFLILYQLILNNKFVLVFSNFVYLVDSNLSINGFLLGSTS